MESIYDPAIFACSEHIPLKDYFTKLSDVIGDVDAQKACYEENSEKALDAMTAFCKEKRDLLQRSCHPSVFENEFMDPPTSKVAQGAIPKRLSFSKPKRDQSNGKSSTAGTQKFSELSDQLKMFQFSSSSSTYKTSFPQSPNTLQSSFGGDDKVKWGSDFALAIRVYHPFQVGDNPCKIYFDRLRFSHEIVVLGTNTLTEFRDKILCRTDVGLCVEVADPHISTPTGNSKEVYPSGFIFIDDVFYNDEREENAVDYSAVIQEWAREREIGMLSTTDMHTTLFADLKPRFGYPYVYQHQGGCEHILTISDAWLLTNADLQSRKDYPYYREMTEYRCKRCSLCYVLNAKWICTESDRLPHANTYLCQRCLMAYHYKAGKKIGNCKIFPYFDTVERPKLN